MFARVCTHGLVGPHREEVRHEGGEAGREAALGDEAELHLGETDGVITPLPVPAGDVQQVRLERQGATGT